MNKVKTSISEMYIDNDGILRVEMYPGIDITFEKAQENFNAIKQLLGNNRALILIISKHGFKFRSDARAYASQCIPAINRVATAFVIKSFATKLVVNLYIKFNKPVIPTRMFSSEENAMKWLKTFFVLPGDEYIKPKKK